MQRGHASHMSILHIFILFNFAVAQPLFDLLSRNAEFFVVRHSSPLEIVLLSGLLCVGFPSILMGVEVVIGWFSYRARSWTQGCVITILVAAIALQALKRVGDFPGALFVLGAGLLGLFAAVSYKRFYPVRLFLTVLSPTVLIFPGLFLFYSPVFKIVFTQNVANVTETQLSHQPPIIVVIFDEFSLPSLMDDQYQIDATSYPHFAALAQNAFWFRNATTVSDATNFAVPAILTGSYPVSSHLPTATDHPHNLFTFLGGVYDVNAFGTITYLCPNQLCKRNQESSLQTRISSLLSDLSIVYLHLLLPVDLSAKLPSITQNWMDFTHNATQEKNNLQNSPLARKRIWNLLGTDLKGDRIGQFLEFVQAIQSSVQPTLYYLHILLPHAPHNYLPSGKIYSLDTEVIGVSPRWEKWLNDEWAVTQNYQRYLLQIGAVDTLLGKLMDRLKTVDLYDSSLIVVTADHGISFKSNDFRRQLTDTNLQDIMSVPLFIKTPNQQQGVISDRNVETIDILPTIADILGSELPWPVDGQSALTSAPPKPKKSFFSYANLKKQLFFDSHRLTDYSAAVKRRLAVAASWQEPARLSYLGLHHDLIGKRTTDVGIAGEAFVHVTLDQMDLLNAASSQSDFLPLHLTGSANLNGDSAVPLHFAIAINGVIQAVTRTWPFPVSGEHGRWSAILDERAVPSGPFNVEVFLITEHEGKPILARTKTKDSTLFLVQEHGRLTIKTREGASFPIVPSELRGAVDYTAVNGEQVVFRGWAVDLKRERLPDSIVAFINGKFFFSVKPHMRRQDILDWLGNPVFAYAGFYRVLPRAFFPQLSSPEIRFFALSEGVASELEYVEGYPWQG